MRDFAVYTGVLRAVSSVAMLSDSGIAELQQVEDRVHGAVLQVVQSAKALETCLGMSSENTQAIVDGMASRRAELERTVSKAVEEARRKVLAAEESVRDQWRESRKQRSVMAKAHNSALESMVLDYRRRGRLRRTRSTPSDEDGLRGEPGQ